MIEKRQSIANICLRPARKIAVGATIALTVIGLTWISFEYKRYIQSENVELSKVVDMSKRALTGEILLGDKVGQESVREHLKTRFGLDEIKISSDNVTCTSSGFLASIASHRIRLCSVAQFESIPGQPQIMITKYVDSRLEHFVLALGVMLLSVAAVGGLAYFVSRRLLLSKVARPIALIESDLLNQVRELLEGRRSEIEFETKELPTELASLSEGIRELATALKTSIAEREKFALEAEKQRAVATTARMLAHDIRHPFNLLASLCKVLKTEGLEREVAGSILSKVNASLSYVDGMIHDLVDFEGEIKIAQRPTHLRSLIDEVVDTLGIESSQLKIDCLPDTGVFGDAEQLKRVLQNILSNALRVTEGNTSIRIAPQIFGSTVELRIRNTNSFVPSDLREEIFNVGVTATTEGKGLGLAIARRIIAAHGGTIVCESSATPAWTEFVIRLTSCAVPAACDASETENELVMQTQKAKPQISVVDDEAAVRLLWQRTALDADVNTFSSPEQFWQRCESDAGFFEKQVAVITDLKFQMNDDGAHGVQFAKELQLRGALAFIASNGDAPKNIDRGRVLKKQPFRYSELVAFMNAEGTSAHV